MLGINVCGNSFQIFNRLKGELNESSVVALFLLLVALSLATSLCTYYYQIKQCIVNQIICSLA